MNERRINWKQNVSKAARQRHNQKLALLTQLDEIREKLSRVEVRSPKYDELMAQRREVAAKIATL